MPKSMTDQELGNLLGPPQQLVLLRGLPGAGKSTRSRRWVQEAPGERARVNRDADRAETFCRDDTAPWRPVEVLVSGLQRHTVAYLLDHGLSVVLDNTHLDEQIVDYWRRYAAGRDVEFVVWDMRDIPLEECIARDRARGDAGGRCVGEAQIRRMHDRMHAQRIT